MTARLMSVLKDIAKRLRVQQVVGISSGHTIISRTEAEQLQFDNQWQDPKLPAKQLEIVKKELADIRERQQYPAHMKALVDEIRALALDHPSVLEIGCSSGYYNEVFDVAGLTVDYHGCDYSAAFIDLAKQRYPTLPFQVADGTALPYADASFAVAISGCCILHILNYEKAIAETARVAKRYAIFHRTPVLHCHPTTYTRKKGYGVDMIEILFNETELFELFYRHGLAVIATHTPSLNVNVPELGEQAFTKNYVCQKR